jgi:hypothetical protein
VSPRAIAGVLAGLSIALACPLVVRAHHSSAMYDRKQLVTLRGVVKEFRWTNPHTTIRVDVDGSKGRDDGLWIVEATSPGNLSRAGWTRTSVRVGERVEVVAAPLRDGGHGAYCESVTLLDRGKKLEC